MGVGFFSVFSLTDAPLVVSPPTALAFYWEGDALLTGRTAAAGVPPAPGGSPGTAATTAAPAAAAAAAAAADPFDDSRRGEGGAHPPRAPPTAFLPPCRDAAPPPDVRRLATFLASALAFPRHLCRVAAVVDGRPVAVIRRAPVGPPAPLPATVGRPGAPEAGRWAHPGGGLVLPLPGGRAHVGGDRVGSRAG